MPLPFSPSVPPPLLPSLFSRSIYKLQCVPKPPPPSTALIAPTAPPPPQPPSALRPHPLYALAVLALTAPTAEKYSEPQTPSANAQTPPPVFVRKLSTVSVRIHHRIMPSWSWNYRNCWQRTGPAINTHEEVSTLLIPILFFLVTSPDYFQHLLPSLDSHLSAFGVGGTGGSP